MLVPQGPKGREGIAARQVAELFENILQSRPGQNVIAERPDLRSELGLRPSTAIADPENAVGRIIIKEPMSRAIVSEGDQKRTGLIKGIRRGSVGAIVGVSHDQTSPVFKERPGFLAKADIALRLRSLFYTSNPAVAKTRRLRLSVEYR